MSYIFDFLTLASWIAVIWTALLWLVVMFGEPRACLRDEEVTFAVVFFASNMLSIFAGAFLLGRLG